MPRVPRAAGLPLRLEPSDRPLRHRIADAVVTELREGRLRPGDPLPSTRVLATALTISRGPVVAAYDELSAAGFIETRPGSGAVVAPLADRAARAGALSSVEPMEPCPTPRRRPPPREARFDLRPGLPDIGFLDRAAWRRAWRVAASKVPTIDLSQAPDHARLRHVLADHIRRSRGIAVDPEELLVTPGVSATLQALPAALGLIGRTVALEDPGYVEAWTAFSDGGVRIRAVAVDDDGLDPALLGRTDAAVYVTPSHQYPLGARMPVARRTALLDWARRDGGLVIEDDYDGEFRYDVSPLPALRSLEGADDHVLYVGTASKILVPTLRVSWLLPPRHLHEAIRGELDRRSLLVNEMTGAAVAEFIASGALSAHHARAARTYAGRRSRVVAALARHLPEHRLSGVDAGLHLVLLLPDDVDDHEVSTALLGRGVLVNPLSAYCVEATRRGLVIGYAGLPETHADAAVRALAHVLLT
ncbi:PLP-dependent aminotransferase family protein [Knoellia aerolata]|uniref:GntR family transcriptional regulator n=1 Tax=Knoellia aerolata DSM 18566 TaxID=1385519 RepID=A0A0A0JYU6_9MICO|nr:PLP-dependent aminotransferase family protein [Knoellia aerolata]KGN42615.1 GntR family transcriptional regulator [Knoellia aerolata DSM 18566]